MFFHYGNIKWTTGDLQDGINGLGGMPARVGISSGTGIPIIQVQDSGTSQIINITTTSDVNSEGSWAFRVDRQSES